MCFNSLCKLNQQNCTSSPIVYVSLSKPPIWQCCMQALCANHTNFIIMLTKNVIKPFSTVAQINKHFVQQSRLSSRLSQFSTMNNPYGIVENIGWGKIWWIWQKDGCSPNFGDNTWASNDGTPKLYSPKQFYLLIGQNFAISPDIWYFIHTFSPITSIMWKEERGVHT